MKKELRAALTVRLFTDKKSFGPGVAELLHRVDERHSLRAAAQSMEMAYSKAWTITKNAEDSLDIRLLASATGGKGGGGARLTDEGRRFLEAYDRFCERLRACGDELFAEEFAFLGEDTKRDD